MKVYITARALYAVQNSHNYCLAQFTSLMAACSYIREKGQSPIFTWGEV